MMRSSQHPLARLVDAAAARWLAAEELPPQDREALRQEIFIAFPFGDLPRVTLHGVDYTLTLQARDQPSVTAHQIVR